MLAFYYMMNSLFAKNTLLFLILVSAMLLHRNSSHMQAANGHAMTTRSKHAGMQLPLDLSRQIFSYVVTADERDRVMSAWHELVDSILSDFYEDGSYAMLNDYERQIVKLIRTHRPDLIQSLASTHGITFGWNTINYPDRRNWAQNWYG